MHIEKQVLKYDIIQSTLQDTNSKMQHWRWLSSVNWL